MFPRTLRGCAIDDERLTAQRNRNRGDGGCLFLGKTAANCFVRGRAAVFKPLIAEAQVGQNCSNDINYIVTDACDCHIEGTVFNSNWHRTLLACRT